jgi:DNA helicase HerA-like ATPase
VKKLGLAGFSFQGYPVVFWDVFREQGHPVRATISEMGPQDCRRRWPFTSRLQGPPRHGPICGR